MKKGFLIFLVLLITAAFLIFRGLISVKSVEPKMKGIILPHHNIVTEIFNSSFKRLKENVNPETIVIFGTNHYFPISETYTTTAQIKEEFDLTDVLANDERISGDHSIQVIMPYIKEYFPNSKVIPIIVSAKYENWEKLNNIISQFIQKFGSEKTLYIASVDFAHNVSLEEGLSKNKESIESISTFNYGKILEYHDDHMDSPIAISTLLLAMQKLGATDWETWVSSHGALVAKKLDLEGTSYVVGSFSQK
jgi:AmmeMemoRadiSam system protein B